MKTNLVYGLYLTLALMLLNLAFYFLGYHSDAEKFATADMVSKIAFWVFAIVFIVLGTRARRSEVPLNEEFGYGQALLSGFLISLFAGLFGIVTNYLYMKVINPGFIEVIIQAATAKAEAKGAGSAQIEQMENFDLDGLLVNFDKNTRHAFGKEISIISGCSKRPSSKAAASEEASRTLVVR